MKNTFKMMTVAFAASILLTSCFSYTSVIGKGPSGTEQVKKWNHYLLDGLVPVSVSDSKSMAAGAENYTIQTKQTFVNGLISVLTLGIYSPTVTTITK